jgi:hypothetical protein
MAGKEKVKFLNFCALHGRKRALLLYHAQGSAHNQLTIDTTMKTYTFTIYSPILNKSFTDAKEFKNEADFRLYVTALYSGNWSLISAE